MKGRLPAFAAIVLVILAIALAFDWLNQQTVEELHFVQSKSLRDTGEWEDIEYWVLFRNVALINMDTGALENNQDILVIGSHIHKIGASPMLIFDKDLSYNFNCEGKIIIPASYAVHTHTSKPNKTIALNEGDQADLMIIDGTTSESLQSYFTLTQTLTGMSIGDHDSTLLIMRAGIVIKDEIKKKRIDHSRLQQAMRRIRH